MSYVYGNTTRLTGLASGMDTESIIKSLMQMEQLKVNRELRSHTLLEWKQESHKSIKSDITGFYDSFLRTTGATSMLRSSTYKQFKVTTSDTSGAVSITANSSASKGSITVNRVIQLAKATRAQSNTDPATNRGAVLRDDLAEGNNVTLGSLNFTNELEFDEDGNFSFEINGETFTFNRNDTLATMVSTVSNNENAGVVFNYSRLSNTFTLSCKETGADGELSFRNITGNAFGSGGAFQIGTVTQGEDARAVINDVVVTRSSNTFTVDGMTFTLNKVTEEDADIRFDIAQDVDASVDAVKEFVNGFNTLIKKLQSLVTEKKTNSEKSYQPLTEEEKADMTESQVEQWEAIAKKGLFYNDRDIQSLITSLRNSLYETIEGAGLSVSQLGLKTGNYFEGNQGEIVLDEDALRAALEADPDAVMNAFMKTPSELNGADGGFIYNLQNIFNNYTKVTQSNTLDSIGSKMKDLSDKISKMELRMASVEESYYMKFAAMEKAMSELQSQSANLASLLGTGR